MPAASTVGMYFKGTVPNPVRRTKSKANKCPKHLEMYSKGTAS